jgi:hypothetical protein
MVKRLGLRKHSASSFQTYPPLGEAAAGIQLPIGQDTHIWGNVLRCYVRRGPARSGPLTVPPVKPDPSRPIATTIWSSGSSQGDTITSHTWMWPIVAASLFNIVSQTCCPASFPGFLPLFLGISILSGISLSWGTPAPFHSRDNSCKSAPSPSLCYSVTRSHTHTGPLVISTSPNL